MFPNKSKKLIWRFKISITIVVWERFGTFKIVSVYRLQTPFLDEFDGVYILNQTNKQAGAPLTYPFYQQFIFPKYWKRIVPRRMKFSILSTPSSFMY